VQAFAAARNACSLQRRWLGIRFKMNFFAATAQRISVRCVGEISPISAE
jgi:hypothetical protein